MEMLISYACVSYGDKMLKTAHETAGSKEEDGARPLDPNTHQPLQTATKKCVLFKCLFII